MAKQYYIEDDQDIPAIQYSETAPEGFTLITDTDLILKLTKTRYVKYEVDGKDFYNEFRSRLYIEIVAGNITPTEAFQAESYLKDLKDNLTSGNWLTAQYVCTNLALSGIFTQDLKDEILAGIATYITANY